MNAVLPVMDAAGSFRTAEHAEQAFAAALADPAFLREAERAFLPLRPLVGPAYRDMAAKVETTVRALWKVRPWSG